MISNLWFRRKSEAKSLFAINFNEVCFDVLSSVVCLIPTARQFLWHLRWAASRDYLIKSGRQIISFDFMNRTVNRNPTLEVIIIKPDFMVALQGPGITLRCCIIFHRPRKPCEEGGRVNCLINISFMVLGEAELHVALERSWHVY